MASRTQSCSPVSPLGCSVAEELADVMIDEIENGGGYVEYATEVLTRKSP